MKVAPDYPEDSIHDFRGSYFFLSNFYPCPFWYYGLFCLTSEHAYQAGRVMDLKNKLLVLRTPRPGDCKHLAHKLQDLSTEEWYARRIPRMRRVLDVKFNIPVLKQRLLTTGNRPLIEGNTWGDTFFGQVRGEGENWQGRLLEEKREKLRAS